ncbi:MAG: hypothetical protein PUC41_03830 [Oscillospiraceae bacterium]|nr:hypothetical protein [Oscillospiraceae bacterium]
MKRFISALSSLCLAATSVFTAFPMMVSAAGSASWEIAEKTVDAGFEVAVPVTVTGDEGTAGFVVSFTYDEALTFKGFEKGDAYSEAEMVLNNDELYVVWAEADGNDVTAVDGSTVVTLNFIAPDAAGKYPVSFATTDVVDTNEERLTITEQDGAVIVRETIAPGSSGWDIGEEYVEGGAEVAVPVTVIGDEGTAGFVVNFDYDEALTFNGITWGDAYGDGAEAVINDGELRVVWAEAAGADMVADDNATVLYLNFTAPEQAGEYPVTFTELTVVNTDGGELTLEKSNGAVIVEENIPEPGVADWDIAEEETAPGATVSVPVYILNDGGSAGFVVAFDYDSNLTFNGISWGDAYQSDAEAVVNNDELRVVWADANGENQSAAAESIVLYLEFVAPDAAGEYPVVFTELTVVDTYGQPLTITQEDGAVIVVEETTTTTTETTTTETTTTETTTSESGTTTTETTTSESGTTTTETTTSESGTTTTETTTSESGTTTTETTTSESGTTTTETTTSESGTTTTETTTSESTTTTTLAPGTVGWYIGEETVAGGSPVSVPVIIKGDEGSAGFIVDFAYDEALTFEGVSWGDAYTNAASAVINDGEVRIVWADDNGENQKAAENAVVVYLNFTAPTADGRYPVTFSELAVVDTNGNPLTLNKEDGAVIVVNETTTTTTETTTSESGTTTTETTITETTTSESGTTTTETTITETTTSESGTTTTETTITETTTSESGTTTTESGTTTTESGTTTTESGTTTTETTTTESGTTTTETTTTETGTSPVIPNHVVYQIDDVNGLAGTTVKVPVLVWYDEGTAGITMQFKVEDGFTISGYEFGNAYTGAEQAVWNPDEYIFVWDSADGENQYAESGATILTLLVDVPADAVANTIYPVEFVNVTVSDTNSIAPEFTTVNGSITILESPIVDPGNVVYNLEDAMANAGDTIDIPLNVWFDDGTAEFTMTFVVPEGFTIEDFTPGAEYAENGTFNFDPETGILTWTSNDGTNFVPQPGTVIGTLTVTIGEDVEAGDYTITLTDVVPTNENGDVMDYSVNDSTVTVSDLELIVVNNYRVDFQEPTRVYYWSHDPRTFQESGGLDGMVAYLYLYQYYVADGYFVDAEGNQILDANGNAMPYSETDTVWPDVTYAFNTVAKDVTATTKPAEDADSPIEVYVPGTHLYPIAFYCDQTGNEIIIGDGSPLYMGEVNIYIGLKGDITLDDKVDTRDANQALVYYNKVVVMGMDHTFHEDEYMNKLAFFLGDVYSRNKYETSTAVAILRYYNYRVVMKDETVTWTDICGYDFLDEFFEG